MNKNYFTRTYLTWNEKINQIIDDLEVRVHLQACNNERAAEERGIEASLRNVDHILWLFEWKWGRWCEILLGMICNSNKSRGHYGQVHEV